MLAAIGNVNPQFASHTNGVLRNGNTAEEMKAAFEIIAAKVGKVEGKNAETVLNSVLNPKTASAASTSSKANDLPYPSQAKVSAFPVGEPNKVAG